MLSRIWHRDAAALYDSPVVLPVVLLAATPQQLIPPDPDRTHLWISADGTNGLYISTVLIPPGQTGICLTAQNPYAVFTWDEHGAIVKSVWWGLAVGAGLTVSVITQSLRRNPQSAGYPDMYVSPGRSQHYFPQQSTVRPRRIPRPTIRRAGYAAEMGKRYPQLAL